MQKEVIVLSKIQSTKLRSDGKFLYPGLESTYQN
jgi:hypothetical protein